MGGDWRKREELFKRAFELTADISPSVLLRRVLDVAVELGDADHGSLVLLSPDGEVQEIVTSGVAHERRMLSRSLVDSGIVGRGVAGGQPIRLAKLGEDCSVVGFPRNRGSQPFLGLPITLWGRVFGAICLGRRPGAEFDEEDEREMALLGAQAGVALDHARLLQEGRVRERALIAVNEVSQAILEGSPTDEVLRLVARWARDLAGAAMAFVNTPDATSHLLTLRAAAGERAEAAVGMVFPVEESISQEVMRSGLPLQIADCAADERVYQPIVRIGNVGPCLFVPLAVGDRAFGTLSVANEPGERGFSDEDLLLVKTFAAEAAVALQYGQFRDELERLSLLEERERIAMDLHDGVIQALFVVGLSLQSAQAVAHDAEEVGVRLADAIGSIDRAIRDLRDYIFGLQPHELADHQLERALRDVATVFQRSGGASTLVEVEPEAAALLTPHAADIIQICREAMSNAVRHSGADRVTLTLRSTGAAVVLEISDNGSGFDPGRAMGTGNGLTNLGVRAKSLGAVLHIDSELGAGSTLRVSVPV
ncbi:MAG TPA: GAF domain-containing protein [Acidimicrobiales bacterium]|nr:GAF domain-containing protein [Acidimicrobiales bacterium]